MRASIEGAGDMPGWSLAVCATVLLALGGCASPSTTESAQAIEPAAVEPAPVAAEATPEAGRRRGRAADADAAPDATIAEPVPDAAAFAHERAVAAIAAGNLVEAELELEQLILEYPEFPGPFVNLAIVYRQDGRDDEARAMLEEALEVAPGHSAANNQLGMLLREAGEFEAAEAAYLRAIASDSSYALAYFNLGVLLDLYLGRGAEALDAYHVFQSLQAEPDAEVGRWIVDLERRVGAGGRDRLAQESAQ